MLEIVFLIILSLYLTQILLFSVGATKKFDKIKNENLPTISIIVAARNEENNILDCLTSLDSLTYPKEKIEIVIVNDYSTDATEEIVKKFIVNNPKFSLILPTEDIGEIKGKARAIGNGIRNSSGEIILTTDADCRVSDSWALTLASYFKEDVAMVCGYTNQYSESIFTGMQSVDFIYLLTVAAGTMNLNKPLSCIGNNMAYRRSVYNEIGGYENIPFSVTEDFQVLMAMHRLNKYKIIYPLDAGGLVTSKACEDIKTLYWQKKRWGVGGIKSEFAGYLVMTIGFLTNLFTIASIILFNINMAYIAIFKVLLDYYFLYQVHSKLKIKLKLKHFIAFELYFIVYVIMLPFMLFSSRKVVWKGREF